MGCDAIAVYKKKGIAVIDDAPGICGRPGSPATHGSLP